MNPETHPYSYNKVAQLDKLQRGDVYKNAHRDWSETSYWNAPCGRTPFEMGLDYFRRKQQQKEPMMKHKYYRRLEVGRDTYQQGDILLDSGNKISSAFGKVVGIRDRPTIRSVQADEWIAVTDRMPTEDDGEEVQIIYDDGSSAITSYRQVRIDSACKSNVYWRRITPPAVVKQPIVITADGAQREVIINVDKSITVGCTTVPSDTMDRIEKARQGSGQ